MPIPTNDRNRMQSSIPLKLGANESSGNQFLNMRELCPQVWQGTRIGLVGRRGRTATKVVRQKSLVPIPAAG
jgi:hypothetical protein